MPLGVAIIGLGMAVTPHARSLQDLEAEGLVRVHCAMSRSRARTEAFARHFDWPVTTDMQVILDDPTIEAVWLLTPPATHLELGRACLQAGKHVLIEKPLAIDSASAHALMLCAQQSGRQLGVVLQHRFRKPVRQLLQWLQQGKLGTLCAAHCHIPWWRNQAYYDEPGRGTLARDGGGVLMTQAIHTLDVFRVLTNGLTVVASQSTTTALHRMQTEDYAAALLRTGNGAPASFMATTAAYPGFSESIELIGTLATARLNEARLEVHYHDGTQAVVDDHWQPVKRDDPMDFPYAAHCALSRDFVQSLRNGSAPTVTAMDAFATQQLIDALLHTTPTS